MTLAIRTTRYFRHPFAIILLAALAGCASFRQVGAFASLSSNAASNNTVMKDYIGSIDRRKQYEPHKFHPGLDIQKARREAQRASLAALQNSVAAYMQALNGLASGNVRVYDESLEELSERVNKASLLNDSERDALYGLSTLLSQVTTALYREHEIRKLIGSANTPLQQLIAAARRITGAGMTADLRAESALVERYYDNFMLAPGNPDEPVAMALAREAKVETLDRVDEKILVAQRYEAVLGKIARGHQYLYEHRDAVGQRKLDRQFQPYVDELKDAYDEFLDVAP